MLAKVYASAVCGIDADLVEVEVDIANGLPRLTIVGLPDTACKESADRVSAALRNSGFSLPPSRITVNLAPADLKKEGSGFDLAIAIGILTADECIEKEAIEGKVFCGELSLDGKIRGVPGVLSRALSLVSQDQGNKMDFVVPAINAKEALCVSELSVYPVKTLIQVVRFLKGEESISIDPSLLAPPKRKLVSRNCHDFMDIKGQWHAKRGLEIAAAGGHNVLLIGPPGSGKTMLAKRLPTILSEMTGNESIETTKIHSVVGLLSRRSALIQDRPFRNPHHTISDVAMIGGGTHPKPGEISLAHNGVLFLDELPEFKRNVLEVLRQPMEDGQVTISRAAFSIDLPARFMLVAAMNPCPCGYLTDPKKECYCTSAQVNKYRRKISGPLLDRMDIHLEVPRLKVSEITDKQSSESSQAIRERVEKARQSQMARYEKEGILSNANLEASQVEKYCTVTEESQKLLKMAIQELGFSARAYHKSLKVARTIADLAQSETIESVHVSEAISYRTLDRSVA